MPPIPTPDDPSWPIPRLSFRVEDLNHPGATVFFESANPVKVLNEAVRASFRWLYTPETTPTHVKFILLILRSMDGVAYTTGSQHSKEIHFSLDHIKKKEDQAADEIIGVLVHEVVHCYQYNAANTCPSGLIEGIADFVRLRAGYEPPHWKRTAEGRWDTGYHITAYFLDWIERRYGVGTIQELNLGLKDRPYHRHIFKELTGRPVRKLWGFYLKDVGQPQPGPGAVLPN